MAHHSTLANDTELKHPIPCFRTIQLDGYREAGALIIDRGNPGVEMPTGASPDVPSPMAPTNAVLPVTSCGKRTRFVPMFGAAGIHGGKRLLLRVS